MFYDSFIQEQSVPIYRHRLTFFIAEMAIIQVDFRENEITSIKIL